MQTSDYLVSSVNFITENIIFRGNKQDIILTFIIPNIMEDGENVKYTNWIKL